MSDNPLESLCWLSADQPFPSVDTAWGEASSAPGLLAAGADLSVTRLVAAYRQGIFPWFGANDPPLWWSPDPRAVLQPTQLRLHRSLLMHIRQQRKLPTFSVRVDTAFDQVIKACAKSPRQGRRVGTWIQPAMVQAYNALHTQGFAHSVEVWQDRQLIGGLYCVAIGRAVFGESMFSTVPNASKIALSALVALCVREGVTLIDCQQDTEHLRLMGSQLIERRQFCRHLAVATQQPALQWQFQDQDWSALSAKLS